MFAQAYAASLAVNDSCVREQVKGYDIHELMSIVCWYVDAQQACH